MWRGLISSAIAVVAVTFTVDASAQPLPAGVSTKKEWYGAPIVGIDAVCIGFMDLGFAVSEQGTTSSGGASVVMAAGLLGWLAGAPVYHWVQNPQHGVGFESLGLRAGGLLLGSLGGWALGWK